MSSLSAEKVPKYQVVRRPNALLWSCACAILLCCSGCRTWVDDAEGPAGSGAASPSVQTICSSIPASLPGGTVSGIEEYPGDRLYDYMNGAAVTYFEYGFKTLGACEVDGGAVKAKVELYQMDSAENAQRVYAAFAGSPGKVLKAGLAGQYWHGFEPEGIFHRGRHFVRVLTYATGADQAVAFLGKVAAALDERLGAQNGKSSSAGAGG